MTTAHPLGFLRPGGVIDSFRIIKALGEGANGVVLLVQRRGRKFALKLARRREDSDDRAKTNQRMTRELGCLIHLEHSNIIRVRAWGHFPDLIGDYSYLVLDYVDGWTLAEWMEKARPSFKQVARVFAKVADALDYMHRRGVFHRDISLSNVLIRKDDGEPFIVDFGAGDFANAQELTEAPLPPGTNRFRAPEAVRFWNEHKLNFGARYSFQAKDDQYALAVCLYDALTDAETAKDAQQRAAQRIAVNSPAMGPPPAPVAVNPRVPQALSALVARAVEHDTAKRLPTLEALRSGLEALAHAGGAEWEAPVFAPAASAPRQGTTPQGRTRGKVAAALAVVVVAAAALALLRGPTPRPVVTGPPAPVGGSHARASEAPVPSSAAPPIAELPSSAPVVPAQKESPTVSAPTPPPRQLPPKQPRSASRTALTPEFLARCAGLGLVAATELGCPAPQVRPEGEWCSLEAQGYMGGLRMSDGRTIRILLDVNQPKEAGAYGVYRTGPTLGTLDSEGALFKEGWRIEGYLWTEGKTVTGRFTRLFPPAGARDSAGNLMPDEVPICMVLGQSLNGGIPKRWGSTPDGVVLPRGWVARFIHGEWPQP